MWASRQADRLLPMAKQANFRVLGSSSEQQAVSNARGVVGSPVVGVWLTTVERMG